MSFRATIASNDKQQLWSRTINVLSSINEYVRFTISSFELIAWTINSTDTTLCKIRFDREFFDEFEFNPDNIIFGEKGVQTVTDSQGVDHKLYSLKVDGLHLGSIARKPEGDGIKHFTIVVNNMTTCPDILVNRLLVYIEMESLICRQYSPQFEPIKYDPIIIDVKYKRKFLEVYGTSANNEPLDPKLLDIFKDSERDIRNALFDDHDPKATENNKHQLTVADEINYICCNQYLIKNFIDNCNANITGELRLEINVSKLSLTAFTTAIQGKNYDVLRNAMSFTNTISTLDLEHYCLFTTVDEEGSTLNTIESGPKEKKDQTKSIVFQLKEFKSFMSLASYWKTLNNGSMNLWFCHRGDPIVFEIKKPGVVIELVQVTISPDLLPLADTNGNSNIPKPIIRKISPSKSGDHHSLSKEIDISSRPSSKEISSSKQMRLSPLKSTKNAVSPVGKIKRRLFIADEAAVDEEAVQSKRRKSWENRLSGRSNSDSGDILDYKPDESQILQDEPKAIPAERNSTTIGWGPSLQERNDTESKVDRISMLKKEKLKYFEGLKINQKRGSSEDQTQSEGLGPTQISKPKGLFD